MSIDTLVELTDYYEKEYDKLVKRMSWRCGGMVHAEDVVQEAFARAIQYINSYDPEKASVERWMTMILNNAAKDFQQDERNQGMCMQEDIVIEDFDEWVHTEHVAEEILEAIDVLREPAKEIIRLFIVMGYQVKEIHHITGVGWHAIRKAIQRFQHGMKERYE